MTKPSSSLRLSSTEVKELLAEMSSFTREILKRLKLHSENYTEKTIKKYIS